VDPRIGTVFAGHRIEEVIGRGGASVVYLAEHLRLGRRVALKVLAPHLAEDEMFRERFIRESRIAAGLDHPNVVTVYDAGEVEDGLYISMRYVEGSDLGRILRDEGALEPPRAILILSQVASGLDAAHAQGLVHRDVKPGNVLVESPGSVLERAYLSDFGISKRTTTGSGLTRTGQFVGTVDYVAPEQITGEPIDGRTDVYSLGCVLFQCLSGQVPFRADTEVATIYRQLNDAPAPIDVAGTDGVNRVIARALSKSKEDRFHSCGALIEAVRSELGGPATTGAAIGRSAAHLASPDAGEAGAGEPRSEAATQVLDRPSGRRGHRLLFVVAAAITVAILTVVVTSTLTDDGPGVGTGSRGSTSSTGAVAAPPEPDLSLHWARVADPDGVFGGSGRQAINDAVVTADGIVAAGYATSAVPGWGNDAAAWRSADGKEWLRSSSGDLGGEAEQRIETVIEFDGRLIAGGSDGQRAQVWVSDDGGASWSRTDAAGLQGPGGQAVYGFVVSGSKLLAVGTSGIEDELDAAVWSSTDGIEWTPVEAPAFEAPGNQQIWAAWSLGARVVAVGSTTELGVGTDAAVWILAAGDWTRVPPEMFDEQSGHEVMRAVGTAPGGSPLVAVGCEDEPYACDQRQSTQSDAAVWTSDDGGSTWSPVALTGPGFVGEGAQVMRALVTSASSLVVVGNRGPQGDHDGAVWTSDDGQEWAWAWDPSAVRSALDGPTDQSMRAVVAYRRHGISLLAFGVTRQGDSEDAQVWTATDPSS
jgi:tRNA A-37 threonylcarbamoyl transferase component Bud32